MPLFLLFLAVPLIEIALFIQAGEIVGLGWILLTVIVTAIAGTWLVKKQGRGVLRELQLSMSEMRDPSRPLAHGAMILFAGALLLTPGFFTDTVGLLLCIPAVRDWAWSRIGKRVVVMSAGGARRAGPGAPPRGGPGPRPGGDPRFGTGPGGQTPPRTGPVIEGEYEETDPEETPSAPPRPGSSGWTKT
ncbi:FxsA family protein [Roseicyclus sp. F158]|uniref:FxsA family protein n=1 Tax=Tropicimonas omnivorans TaxID=3075590 RepID=A0ABU3DCN6_9RHOB|nr:FxsA family protein [Roseicyclus sp. F158]MDT0681474.1 FxsA family protein [Roseicyclus sp. F158]